VAKEEGITPLQAWEIWKTQFKFIHQKSKEDLVVNEDGTFKPESFKTTMLPYFGKITPNLKKINKLNGETRSKYQRQKKSK
jgi:hypothetical protein